MIQTSSPLIRTDTDKPTHRGDRRLTCLDGSKLIITQFKTLLSFISLTHHVNVAWLMVYPAYIAVLSVCDDVRN